MVEAVDQLDIQGLALNRQDIHIKNRGGDFLLPYLLYLLAYALVKSHSLWSLIRGENGLPTMHLVVFGYSLHRK